MAAAAATFLAVTVSGCTRDPEPPPPIPAPVDVRIAAVGDMNGEENIDPDSPSGRNAAAITELVHHEPYFTSDTDDHDRASDHKPWIDVMWKHRVRLTLSGSQHNYERSCAVNNADRCVEDGITAFQVSTGGIDLRPFTSSPQYIEKRFSDTHGFLRLTLRTDGSFDWNFVPTSGEGTDEGTRPAPEPDK